MSKKALAVISFGTTYKQAREAIEKIEKTLAAACPEHDFFRAFTSSMVMAKIKREEGVTILNPRELLESLLEQGYTEVICQSLHVIPGFEYEKMCQMIEEYKDKFEKIEIGKPMLYDQIDYLRCGKALIANLPRLQDDEAVVYMGHGTEHPSNASYALMENTFRFLGAERIYMATVEGFPSVEYILRRLHAKQVSKVYLAPFMIVAGDHAQNDLAGDEEDSWKSILETEGYGVQVLLKGLGEYDEISDLFVQHLPK